MISADYSDTQNQAKLQILLVEDERIVALDMRLKLSQLGYTVCGYAPSGEQALRIASESRPDLVLMDIKLEGSLDGIETAARLHEHATIPVIYTTAYTDPETRRRAEATHPAGYLAKPIDQSQLERAILEATQSD
jgi:CheY-like chemotaxis protein